MTIVLILLFLLLSALCVAVSILGSVDAFRFPPEVWAAAGPRRAVWVWQAAGVLFAPLALVYSGLYFVRVRPRLVRARGESLPAYRPDLSVPLPPHDDDRPIRIRLPIAFTVVQILLLDLVLSWELLGSGRRHLSLYLAYVLTYTLISLLMQRRFGITLTRGEAVVRGLTTRRIPWTSVVGVTQDATFGGRRVVLWREGGRRTALRAPCMVFPGLGRARYERDFHTIGQWWLRHRSAPPPAPA